MAWEWLENGAKRLQNIGDEYKQHHALVEHLLTLDAVGAQLEVSRLWPTLDDRARAGLKMTLAGLTLSHQAATASAEAAQRTERLKALHAAIEQAARGTPSPAAAGASTEAAFTAGAARVTHTLANVAGRARPKAEELLDSARKGIEKHAPAVGAAVKSVVDELLNTPKPGASTAPPPEPQPATAPAETPVDEQPSAPPGTTIAGHWVGTLRGATSTDTLGCDLHVAPSGRPLWTYHDTNGFQQRELTHDGQVLEYVPPDRGVVRVKVLSVTGSPGETGYVVDYSLERSSNGYLTQHYQRLALAGRLRGAQLDVTYTQTGISSFGDKTGLAATEDATEHHGALTKQG